MSQLFKRTVVLIGLLILLTTAIGYTVAWNLESESMPVNVESATVDVELEGEIDLDITRLLSENSDPISAPFTVVNRSSIPVRIELGLKARQADQGAERLLAGMAYEFRDEHGEKLDGRVMQAGERLACNLVISNAGLVNGMDATGEDGLGFVITVRALQLEAGDA